MDKNKPEMPFDTGKSIMFEDMKNHRFYVCPNCEKFYAGRIRDCITRNQVCVYCGQVLESRKVKI